MENRTDLKKLATCRRVSIETERKNSWITVQCSSTVLVLYEVTMHVTPLLYWMFKWCDQQYNMYCILTYNLVMCFTVVSLMTNSACSQARLSTLLQEKPMTNTFVLHQCTVSWGTHNKMLLECEWYSRIWSNPASFGKCLHLTPDRPCLHLTWIAKENLILVAFLASIA